MKNKYKKLKYNIRKIKKIKKKIREKDKGK